MKSLEFHTWAVHLKIAGYLPGVFLRVVWAVLGSFRMKLSREGQFARTAAVAFQSASDNAEMNVDNEKVKHGRHPTDSIGILIATAPVASIAS